MFDDSFRGLFALLFKEIYDIYIGIFYTKNDSVLPHDQLLYFPFQFFDYKIFRVLFERFYMSYDPRLFFCGDAFQRFKNRA